MEEDVRLGVEMEERIHVGMVVLQGDKIGIGGKYIRETKEKDYSGCRDGSKCVLWKKR